MDVEAMWSGAVDDYSAKLSETGLKDIKPSADDQ
jgi:hypothetical protein